MPNSSIQTLSVLEVAQAAKAHAESIKLCLD